MAVVDQVPTQKVRMNVDYMVLASVTILICLYGAVMVTSASSVFSTNETGSAWKMAQTQVIAMVIGAIGLYIISRMSMRALKWWAVPVGLVAIAGLVLVLIIGDEVGGQRNWINLGVANLKVQPSELGKLGLVLLCALFLSSGIKMGWNDGLKITSVILVSSVITGLVVLEKDMGTPIILAGMTLGILSLSGMRKKSLAGISLAGVIAVIATSLIGPSYRLDRFYAWLTPDSGAGTYGYQINHGQYALADGGLFGHGLGNSSEKWGALPAAHTDFILSVIGEELGLVGTMAVLLFLTTIVLVGFRIAERATDDFGRIAAFGVTLWIALQTIVNVGAIVRFLPITGVTLPFVSYGGSAIVPMLAGIGVLLAVARDTSLHEHELAMAENEVEG